MRPAVLLALLCAAGLPRAQADSSPRLPRSSPEEQGIAAQAVLGFVEQAEAGVDHLHSFMLVRHGKVVAEGWWSPYAAAEPHSLYSLSKSFTSTAVGLAIAEGRLSLDARAIDFFPKEAPANPGANLRSLRVRDLLRMSTGQSAEDINAFSFDASPDLVKAFFAMPVVAKPGTHFVYNTAATFLLSAIVQKATGQTVRDYLQPRLFDPLGMGRPHWDASRQGVSLGGFGLSLRTEDIAKFGLLCLRRGNWEGRQLLPASWVDAATSLQTANGSDPTSDWDQGYGYQFWRCRHGFYRGDGAFGQFCIVMPQYDAVIALTSATNDMQAVMNLVWDRIVPAFRDGALPPDPEADRRLRDRLAGLVLPVQGGAMAGAPAVSLPTGTYAFDANSDYLESLRIEPAAPGSGVVLAARIAGIDQRLACGEGAWRLGRIALGPDASEPVALSGAWTAPDTFTVKVCRYRTPFCATYAMHFSGRNLAIDRSVNVDLKGDLAPPPLLGKAE